MVNNKPWLYGSVSKPIDSTPSVHIKIAGLYKMDVHSPKNGIFIGIDP
jgi:hypothetical protein